MKSNIFIQLPYELIFGLRKAETDIVATHAAIIFSLLEFIRSNQPKSKDNEGYFFTSKKDLMFFSLMSEKQVSAAMNRLIEEGLIRVSKKKALNGGIRVQIDNFKTNIIMDIGRNIYKSETSNYLADKKENFQKAVKKQEEFKKEDVVWTEERTFNINKMAYEEGNGEDIYNTGLNNFERFAVMIISKAYYRFSGNLINWSAITFNCVRKYILGCSKNKFDNEDDYNYQLTTKGKPQYLINIVKYMCSDRFEKEGKNHSSLFQFKFQDAKLALEILEYRDPDFRFDYENLDYNDFEDRDYYLDKVDISNPKFEQILNPYNYNYEMPVIVNIEDSCVLFREVI